MQTAARNNLILTSYSSYAGLSDSQSTASRGGLFLQVLLNEFSHSSHSRQELQNLANKLIRIAEHAYSLRDMETVEEAGLILLNLPLEATQPIGRYYRSLYLKRSGQIDKAQLLLEAIAKETNVRYRARATQTLGTIYHEQGNFNEALRLYLEAAKITSFKRLDIQPAFMAHLQLSFIRSDSGDHNGALTHLQKLFPLLHLAARHIPFYFYVYHSDLAYELAQVGRLSEAEAAISIALNSPFAMAYPEWGETRDEIAAKRRAVTRSHSQVAIQCTLPRKSSPQPLRKAELAIALGLPIGKGDYLQANSSLIVARAIAHSRIARPVTERIHRCVNPRAPPRSP